MKLTAFLLSFFYFLTSYADNTLHTYELNNGLKIIVKEDHRSHAIVNMVWYRVGSAYEHNGTTGISHALEHMMFQGTPTYPKGQFSKIIAENGGEENAFTAQDFTAYFEKLDSQLLPLAFKLESDRMQNLSLKEENFLKEIQVVREERRMRIDDNPQALTFERFMATAYLSTPYHNPIIGWPDDLKNLNIHDVRNWYQTWYAPNNATLVVVGDVKADEVYTLAKKYFDKISSHILPAFKTHDEPPALGAKNINVKKGAREPLIIMGYVTPTRVTEKESWKPYALTLLSGILSAGDSSRLTSHLVHDQQIANDAGAYYDMYSLYQTPFIFAGTPTEKHTIADLKKAFSQEIATLQKTKVSEKELTKIKNQIIASNIYSRDSLMEQAVSIGTFVSIGLQPNTNEQDIKKIQMITPEQIQMVAREYFISDHLTTAVLIPQSLTPAESATLQNNAMIQGALR